MTTAAGIYSTTPTAEPRPGGGVLSLGPSLPAVNTDPYAGLSQGTASLDPRFRVPISADQLRAIAWNNALPSGTTSPQQLLQAYMAFHNGAQPPGGAPTHRDGGGGTTSGGGAANPLDPIAMIHAEFDKQRSAVDANTMMQVAALQKEHANAVAGNQQVGTQALAALQALGKDAQGQNALSNAAVAKDFAGAQGAINNQYQQLLADLTRQGAQTQALSQEADAQHASTAAAGADQQALSQRLGQLLNQTINDREATSKQVTTGSVQDLARVMQQAYDAATQAGTNQKNALSSQEQQAVMQEQLALANAAKAARSSGGSRSSGSSGGKLTTSEIIGLLGKLKGTGGSKAGTDYFSLLKNFLPSASNPNGIDMSNPKTAAIVNGYLTDLTSGKISPSAALTNANSRGFTTGHDSFTGTNLGPSGQDIINLLTQAQAQQGAASNANSGFDPSSIYAQMLVNAGVL